MGVLVYENTYSSCHVLKCVCVKTCKSQNCKKLSQTFYVLSQSNEISQVDSVFYNLNLESLTFNLPRVI